jgi:hypothetical protein
VWKIAAADPPKRPVVDATTITAKRPPDELKGLLGAPRLDVRRAAARSLAATEAGRSALLGAIKEGREPERSRVEALWALASVEPAGAREDLLATGVLSRKDAVSTAAALLIGSPGVTLDDAGVRRSVNELLGLLLSDEVDVPFDRGLALPLFAKSAWSDGDRLVAAALSVRDPFVTGTMIPALAGRLSSDELAR